MDRHRHINRGKTRLHYHMVLTTKYRTSSIADIEDEVISSLHRAASRCDGVKIRAIGVDSDHVHMVIDSSPRWSPAQVVGRLKQLTTHDLWKRHGDHLKQYYWKGKRVLWSDGYFCESIGSVSEEVVLDYVRNQGKGKGKSS